MLEYLLEKVGKACFANCFDEFEAAHRGALSRGSLIEVMLERGGARTPGSAATKARRGVEIFERGFEFKALKIVASSAKVEGAARLRAAELSGRWKSRQ